MSLALMDQWETQTCKWKMLTQSYVLSRLETNTGGCKSKEVQLPRIGGEEEIMCKIQERLFGKVESWRMKSN